MFLLFDRAAQSPPTHHAGLQGKWCSQTCDSAHSFHQRIALALESVPFTEQLAVKRTHAAFLTCDKCAARPSARACALAFFFAGNCGELLRRDK
jgi:hypothetical protein